MKILVVLILCCGAACGQEMGRGSDSTTSQPLRTSVAKPGRSARQQTTTSSSRGREKQAPLTQCQQSYIESDECLQNALFIGQERADIPHSPSHMSEYCEEKKAKLTCIRQYGAKCLKNVPRQIYLTITKNVKKMFKKFCDTEEGQQSFLKHLECIKPEHLKILNEVLGKLTLALEFVAQNVSRERMITYACCALYKTYDEIPNAMGGICAPRNTPEETIDFFRSLVRNAIGDVLDIGCGKFNSFDYCQTNLKLGVQEIEKYVSSGRPLPGNSFMTPLMEFAQKLDGN